MIHLTYAIGDVHGCYDLLRQAMDAIARHSRARPHHIVLLGDYVDRGDDPCRTVSFLMSLQRQSALTCLKGNHEQMLLDCVDTRSPQRLQAWMRHGGRTTLVSYGANNPQLSSLDILPESHVRWLRVRPSKLEDAHHIYVHAGIDPDMSLVEQDETEFLWIRDRFVRAKAEQFRDLRHVVHGHTPIWEGKPEKAIPELLAHRTNLDTAAYETGVLSVGVFVSDRRGGAVDLLSIV